MKYLNYKDSLALIKDNKMTLNEVREKLHSSKFFTIDVLKINGLELKNTTKRFKADKEIVTIAFKNNYKSFEYAAKTLKEDIDFVMELFEINENVMSFANIRLDDETLILEKTKTKPNILKFVNKKFLKDSTFMKKAIENNIKAIQYDKSKLSEDVLFIEKLIKKDRSIYGLLNEKLRNNIKLAIASLPKIDINEIKMDGIECDPFIVITEKPNLEKCRYNKEMINDTVSDGCSKEEAEKLFSDYTNKLIMILREYKGIFNETAFSEASYEIRNDENLAKIAIEENNEDVQYVSEKLLKNKEFVLFALPDKTNKESMFVIDPDKEYSCLGKLSINAKNIFELTGDLYTDDKEVGLAAVKYDVGLYNYLSDRLKNDEEIKEIYEEETLSVKNFLNAKRMF